ncbi:MAG: cation-translocating P-type ATPase [Bacteroidetes bacterium]|nr:cation-translocating P-type ATPase [Bacteroidota bacterium]
MQDHISYTDKFFGLKKSDVPSLIKQFGKNIFKADNQRGYLRMIWDILTEPMFLMLFAACCLYFILGESSEGFLMLAAMFFVAAISLYQEVKSSRALSALKQYTEPKITVVRDGEEQIIFSEELLPGDVMILEEGNRIPADAEILQSNDLTVNESIITGESIPVEKNANKDFHQLLQGTTINSGMCYAKVTATGNRTMLGRLGKSIATINSSKTLLQQQIGRFVKIMAVFGISAFALIWLINYINSDDIVQSLLLGLTLAMSAVPEEIPVAFSSFMALGASHMAKLGIITRQPQTIENLGAVSVICLDKTGTITENKMQVKEIFDFRNNQFEEIVDHGKPANTNVLQYARLASELDPFDAMEKAIVEAYQSQDASRANYDFSMIHEYPLEGVPPMMTHVYFSEGNQLVAAKGAPERILRVCNLDDFTKQKIEEMIKQMTSSGYRVLGVCSVANHVGDFPERQDDFNWEFEGLLALYDSPKKNVENVFRKWYDAGIDIKLITGDYAETAMNIATQAGINHNGKYITGAEVMQMSIEELQQTVKKISIYARMFPDAKLKIVDVLKTSGNIVAMTGDGVNDGPALKSAQIGIAMGDKGTEIAKEAADLIITDDDLDKITSAIQQGRKIYSNLKKAIRYIISIHIPIIFTASMPLLLGWKFPNIFTPIHIIFLELIMGPTCSIFYEREPVENNIMRKQPRSRTQNIFSWNELLVSIIQGLIIMLGILGLYYYFMQKDYPIKYIRTIVFTTLILSNIFLTLINRSFEETFNKTIRYKNSLAGYVLLISVIFLSSIYFIKPLQTIFELTSISFLHYFICIVTSIICTAWFELYKGLRKETTSVGSSLRIED